MSGCRFLTNHAKVLRCIAGEPGIRLRDIGDCVGITERAAHRIVCELEKAGYLTRHKNGSRNTYEIHPDLPLEQDRECQVEIRKILALLLEDTTDKEKIP